MERRIVVQKFGGTSVADDAGRYAAAQRVIASRHAGMSPVVVVSAMGRYGAPYATDTMINFARSIGPDMAKRELDLLMACGELISTVIMAHTIRHLSGINTVAVTGGQAGIVTNWDFGNARIRRIHPDYLLHCLEREKVPIVAGFQGITEQDRHGVHGAVTTLGRGGSDTTATALGVAMQAEAVEIFTDVNGVLTADPDIVPTARTLPTISYEEICEMSYLGAKVIHPRAAEMAMQHDLALWIKRTKGEGDGTFICQHSDQADPKVVTGVTHSGVVAPVTLHIQDEEDKPWVEHEIFRLLATADIPVYLASTTRTTITFCLDKSNVERLQAVLNAVVVPVRKPSERGVRVYIVRVGTGSATYEVQRKMIEGAPEMHPLTVTARIGQEARIVSLIGLLLQDTPGVMARMARALERAGIEPLQTADSRISLSVLVSDAQASAAVSALHQEFVESQYEEARAS